jgi:histidinol-phosphate aminotransferase
MAFRENTMSRFWSKVVNDLTPYIPGEQPKLANLIKLNTNENPYPPSPAVLAAIQAELGDDAARLRLYPDPNADLLKAAIAKHHAIAPQQVFVGNGSDEVLAHVFIALLKHERPSCSPTSPTASTRCIAGCTTSITAPYRWPMTSPSIRRITAVNRTAASFSPTRTRRPAAWCRWPTSKDPVAGQHGFGGGRRRSLCRFRRRERHSADRPLPEPAGGADPVQVALAGRPARRLRGRPPDLIEALERVKNSFNSYPLDRLAIAGAVAAFEDANISSRPARPSSPPAKSWWQNCPLGFDVLPSAANFIFARHPQHDAEKSAQALRMKKHHRAPLQGCRASTSSCALRSAQIPNARQIIIT